MFYKEVVGMEEENYSVSVLEDVEKNNFEECNNENIDSIENSEKSEEIDIDTVEDTLMINNNEPETANCLALSLQSDQKAMMAKNTLIGVARMTIKTALATAGLGILKLFFR